MNRCLFAAAALLAVTPAFCLGANEKITADELLAGADARIARIRKADVIVKVVDRAGTPVARAAISIEQTRHAFLFGCNIFRLFAYTGEQHETYGREFAALLNYATLPFYWGSYEREPGKTNKDDLMRMARWCKDHDIATKGHPLVYYQVYPSWAPSDPDETREALRARVTDIVCGFKGLIDRWDVVNEAIDSARSDNGIGRWTRRDGAAKMVGEALDWAHAANPKACLVYNDNKVDADFKKLISDLVAARKPFDAIGIQSHMHEGDWPLERAWEVCQTYAKFGKPLHFTELTVLSGEHGDLVGRPWPTTPEGEARQADYVEKFYTLLFSHPAVQAITWWDLMDGAWKKAPAGLVRADLTPKPAYDRLMKLVKGKWWTKASLVSDAKGRAGTRAFLGRYRVTVASPKGRATQEFDLKPGRNVWTIKIGKA